MAKPRAKKRASNYFYVLRCKDGSLYCGSAKNLAAREEAHNAGKGSVYVKTHGGGAIIYHENCGSWSRALKREAEVKRWPKSKKESLVLKKFR